VVIAEIFDGDFAAAASVPHPCYGESVDSVVRALEDARRSFGVSTAGIAEAMAPARRATRSMRRSGTSTRSDIAVPPISPVSGRLPLVTAYTLGPLPPADGRGRNGAAHWPLPKLKLTGDGDIERVRPRCAGGALIVDATPKAERAPPEG
jgi:hypothetical protein